jgi:hypothetical protein
MLNERFVGAKLPLYLEFTNFFEYFPKIIAKED